MHLALQTLLDAAILAPSGDNLQPWTFRIDELRQAITIAVDAARDPSPMNAGQRMSRIAIGAAVENIVRTAQANGWTIDNIDTSTSDTGTLTFRELPDNAGEIPALLKQRCSNRRIYTGEALAPEQLTSIQQRLGQSPGGLSIAWVAPAQLPAVAKSISMADMAMFGIQAVRKSFAENIDFQAAPGAMVNHKLSVESLELSGFQKWALQVLPKIPDGLLKVLGGLNAFGAHSRKLVQSSSGLALVLAADVLPATDLAVGRRLEALWLELNAGGCAVQPMMSLPVLDNMASGWPTGSIATQLTDQLRALLSFDTTHRVAGILRFGHAPAPTGRVGRLGIT